MNEPSRTLDTPHLFSPPKDRTDWEQRAATLRRQILCSAGRWPLPAERTPPNAQITGTVAGDGFRVENIALETLPGFFLCGNLYLPAQQNGPVPLIVNPHGHWELGRLHREPDVAPPPPNSAPAAGRADLVLLAATLARQGFAVFAYDMVGYSDTRQLGHDFAGRLDDWLWGISLLGLQLHNSLQVVDYLASRPEIDSDRIGATGASGGATQIFLLAAVDERIQVTVPVNMISATMQGGCLCENAPGLRIGTDNVEIAALTAPRPQLLVAATGDWTRDNPRVEFPALQSIYRLYAQPERVAVRQFPYEHNYNRESRQAMYAWMHRWLRDDPDADVTERPCDVALSSLRVPLPPAAKALSEEKLIAALKRASSETWRKDVAQITTTTSLHRFQERYEILLRPALAIPAPARRRRQKAGSPDAHADLSALIVTVSAERDRAATIRDALIRSGTANAEILLLPPGDADATRLWNDYFSTYNRTPLGDHVQRITDQMQAKDRASFLIGIGAAGAWTLLARALLGAGERAFRKIVIELADLTFDSDAAFLPHLYAPGL